MLSVPLVLIPVGLSAVVAAAHPKPIYPVRKIATNQSDSTWLYLVPQDRRFVLDLHNVLQVDWHMMALGSIGTQFLPAEASNWLALNKNNLTLSGKAPHLSGNGADDVHVTFHARWKGQWHDSFMMVRLFEAADEDEMTASQWNGAIAAIVIICVVTLLMAVFGCYYWLSRRKAASSGGAWSRAPRCTRLDGGWSPRRKTEVDVEKAPKESHSMPTLVPGPWLVWEKQPPSPATSAESIVTQNGGICFDQAPHAPPTTFGERLHPSLSLESRTPPGRPACELRRDAVPAQMQQIESERESEPESNLWVPDQSWTILAHMPNERRSNIPKASEGGSGPALAFPPTPAVREERESTTPPCVRRSHDTEADSPSPIAAARSPSATTARTEIHDGRSWVPSTGSVSDESKKDAMFSGDEWDTIVISFEDADALEGAADDFGECDTAVRGH